MSTSVSPERARRSNLTLWLILAVCLAPLVLSYALYALWRPQSFVNYGELIDPPVALAGVSLPRAGGAPFRFSELSGKWVYLIVDSGACDTRCQRKLYYVRQVRLTQGKDQSRVERLWLISDQHAPAAELEREYHGTIAVRLAATDFLSRLPARNSAADHIYLVDPLGNLMMRYPAEPDPSRMKKDLTRLLKLSGGWIQAK